jgi:phosphate transport system substrate-binding protein
MTRLFPALVAFLALAFHIGFAQDQESLAGLEPYQPQQSVTGTIRSRGNNYASALMKLWEDGFRKRHPAVRFETTLKGSETAIAGLYSGEADLGFLGREIYQPENDAFEEWFGYRPLGIEVTTGSYNNPHKTFALMIFVHKDNPLSRLTMAQIAGIAGCERTPGAMNPIRTWGQLGLTAEWANRPVHVYGYGTDSGFGRFFRMRVLTERYKWNSELKEFYNEKAANGSDIDSSQLILDALATDPDGIAYSNVSYMNANVKTVAVASNDSGPFIEPTKEKVWKRTYPISRFTSVFINRVPGSPIDPKVKEFLRYILSRDGQDVVAREGSYLPLTADLIRDQLRKLK